MLEELQETLQQLKNHKAADYDTKIKWIRLLKKFSTPNNGERNKSADTGKDG